MRGLLLVSVLIMSVGCARQKAQDYSVPALMQSLKDKDSRVRYTAVKHLGRHGHEAKAAVPALAEALKDKDMAVRIGAAYALAEIGPDALPAVPALKEAAKHRDKKLREAAAYALKHMQKE